MPFETHYLHISTRLSILQDSWQLQTGKLKEKIKKENSLRAGGGSLEKVRALRPREELEANFAFSEKQNAEGKWEIRREEVREQEYDDL